MRRKTALVGYCYLAGMFFASFLSVQNIFIIATFLMIILAVIIIFNYKSKLFIVSICSFTFAMAIFGVNSYINNKNVSKFNDSTANFQGQVTDYRYTSNDVMIITAKGKIDNFKTSVTLFAPYQDCEYYDDISFEATFKEIENNVSFNSKSYNNANGIYLTAQNPQNFKITKGGFNLLKSVRNFSDEVYLQIVKTLPENEGAFLGAMLCGNRDYMDNYSNTALFKAGIGHIFSVSGTHLVIISFIFSYIFQALKFSKKTNLFLVEIVIILFAVFAGMSSSIIRSAIMMTILNLSKIVKRQSDSLTTIAICGIILTIFSPEKIRSASFLLSMSGAFAMAVVTPRILKELKYNGKFKKTFESFVGCVTVWLVSTPFVLMFFNEISVFSVIFNLVFLPLCTTALVLTVIGALPMIVGFTITPCLMIAGKCVSVVTFFAKLLGKLKFSTIPLGYVSIRVVLLVSITLTIILFIIKRKFKPLIKYVAIFISAVVLVYSVQIFKNREVLKIYLINYKNSFLLVLNNGTKAVIIDNDGEISDSGIRILEYYGIKELSAVVTYENNESAKGFYYNNTDFIDFNINNCSLYESLDNININEWKVSFYEDNLVIDYNNNQYEIPYFIENDNENGFIYEYSISKNNITKGEFHYAFS